MVALGQTTAFLATDARIWAFSLSDGHQLWTRDLSVPDLTTFVTCITVVPGDVAVVSVSASFPRMANGSFVATFDVVGNQLWRRDDLPDTSAADSAGQVHMAWNYGRVEAVAPDGSTVWTAPFATPFAPTRALLAVWNGLDYAGGTLLRTSDGLPTDPAADRSGFASLDSKLPWPTPLSDGSFL